MFVGRDMKVSVEGIKRPKGDAFLEAVWSPVIRLLKQKHMRGVQDCYD
jgi:hypothetical protein